MKEPPYINNWHGKPIGELTRGELIDALDWCCKELKRHNEEYAHKSAEHWTTQLARAAGHD